MKYAVEPGLIPQIKSEYVQGKGSIREICERFGVTNYDPVKVRPSKEKWKEQRETLLNSISENSTKKAQTRIESRLERVACRGEKYEDMIDKSIETLVGSEGSIDPEAINGYSRALKNLDDMVRRSMGLVDPSLKVDVTTGGKSIGESIIEAIAKIRSTPEASPRLTDEEFAKVVDCEIVD